MCLMCYSAIATAQEPVVAKSDTVITKPQPALGHHVRRTVVSADTTAASKLSPVRVVNVSGDTITFASIDSIQGIENVEILTDNTVAAPLGKVRTFNPDPQRALWLSALCPGLGQIYNRRYWKLPIVVGSFVGLSYGASWNNRMYKDYSKGYRDVMDDDPFVLINPEILEKSGEQRGYEGCLSYVGMSGIVTRPEHVKVRFTDLQGDEYELEGDGLLARCICHEVDHLEGHMYTDFAEPDSVISNEELAKQQKEAQEEGKEEN